MRDTRSAEVGGNAAGGHTGRVTVPGGVTVRGDGVVSASGVRTEGVVRSRVPRDREGAELSVRKRLDHRGPLSIDVTGAWYFITICAEGHRPWVATKWPSGGDVVRSAGGDGRAVAPQPPTGDGATGGMDGVRSARGADPTANPSFDDIAAVILREARENHVRGIWRLALFLVMPDHLHFIVHVPDDGGRGATALPGGEVLQCDAISDRPSNYITPRDINRCSYITRRDIISNIGQSHVGSGLRKVGVG